MALSSDKWQNASEPEAAPEAAPEPEAAPQASVKANPKCAVYSCVKDATERGLCDAHWASRRGDHD